MPLLLIGLEATPIAPDFLFVLVGIPALFFIWACLGLWTFISSIHSAKHGEWSRASVKIVLPLIVLIAGLQYWSFIHLCNYCGDVVHFIALRPRYLNQIESTPSGGAPRLLVFNRGGMIWASRGYVYDESDEILRAEPQQSTDWKIRASQTELTCGYFAETFPGSFSFTKHWYIASFNC